MCPVTPCVVDVELTQPLFCQQFGVMENSRPCVFTVVSKKMTQHKTCTHIHTPHAHTHYHSVYCLNLKTYLQGLKIKSVWLESSEPVCVCVCVVYTRECHCTSVTIYLHRSRILHHVEVSSEILKHTHALFLCHPHVHTRTRTHTHTHTQLGTGLSTFKWLHPGGAQL